MLLKNLEIYFSKVNTTYNSTQDMIDKLQSLKGKTNITIYQNISNYYDKMNYRRQSDTFYFEKLLFLKMQKVLVKFIMKNY